MEDHLIAVLVPAVKVHSRGYDIHRSVYSRDPFLILPTIFIVLRWLSFLYVFALGRRKFGYRFPVVFAEARTDIEELRIESFDDAFLFCLYIL